ncbi:MAG TPA: (d)CMP kinase [Microthrixaceae bacterium]|nr:(d)CMP kinase [Microthrixaceae bacterium]
MSETDRRNTALRIIAIDGPAGSGKSTVGKLLATRLGLTYLDTGAMYRAVAFAALDRDVGLGDIDKIGDIARSVELTVDSSGVFVDGIDATDAIRGPEVSAAVSAVAANTQVREELRGRQRAWADAHGGGVVEGRDIGSVVFPDALLKVYLTADPEVRANRRAAEIGTDDANSVANDLARRDAADRKRADSPLVEPDGAVTVDTTDLGIEAVVELIAKLSEERQQ